MLPKARIRWRIPCQPSLNSFFYVSFYGSLMLSLHHHDLQDHANQRLGGGRRFSRRGQRLRGGWIPERAKSSRRLGEIDSSPEGTIQPAYISSVIYFLSLGGHLSLLVNQRLTGDQPRKEKMTGQLPLAKKCMMAGYYSFHWDSFHARAWDRVPARMILRFL